LRTCKVCKTKFEPQFNSVQPTCGYKCAIEYAKNLREKKEKKEWKARKKVLKEKVKTKSDYEKELEKVFNEFIRERDKHLPCVSCGAPAGTYKLTAGHFYPAGSYKNLRFTENNVHGQCWYNCNKNRHGNLQEYRVGIVSRIKREGLEELDKLARIPRHYTIGELILMKEDYKERIRKLKEKL